MTYAFSRILCILALLCLSSQVSANSLTGSRLSTFKKQTKVLDGRAAQQYAYSDRFNSLLDPYDIGVSIQPENYKAFKKRYSGRYKGAYLPMARAAAQRHKIPEELFLRLVQQESGWSANIRSHKGAIGLAQLMPQTAKSLGVDPYSPKQNLEGGARYLRAQYETFGSWPLALAAYNAGPGAVKKYKGVPPYKETRNYVRIIWGTL